MKNWFKNFGGWLLLGILLISGYKLFDNFLVITSFFTNFLAILKPFIYGAVLAYFVYIPASKIETLLTKKPSAFFDKYARIISILVVYVILFGIIIIGVNYLIPLLKDNLMDLINRLPSYISQWEAYLSSISTHYDFVGLFDRLNKQMNAYINNFRDTVLLDLDTILTQSLNVVSTLYNLFMTIMICPYLLIERENLEEMLDRALALRMDHRDILFIHRYANKINRIFSDFIFGKALDSLVIGVIAYVLFTVMKLNYPIVYALLIGFTNMIPYFGPFIGAIPVVVMVLLTMNISSAIWVVIAILCLQQFDGLLLGPFILGESLGVRPLWIIFAITLFGGLWGFVGMFIGVPLIATLSMIFDDYIRYQNAKKEVEL